MDAKQIVLIWTGVLLSGVLAILWPTVVWRRLRRPETLREAWPYTRPSLKVTVFVIALATLALGGMLTAFLAEKYPFMWATVALFAGGLAATML